MTRLSPYVLTLLALVSVVSGQKLPFAVGETVKGCDLFSGKWVLDETRPLYQEKDCPFLLPQLTCEAYGRPDKEYLKWRWQPNDCSLASFNASLVLETLRGKRMMFVGDSINRGQFNSFVCLVHSIIPEQSKSIITNKAHTVFTAKDYNATIEFFWAPFLLRSNADNPAKNVPIAERIVFNGSINTYGHHWKGVDIIIFDTYFWWGSATTFKILEGGHFNDTGKKIVELSIEDSYRLAMESMLDWVKRNMDPKMTRTFFMSMSPAHQWSREWGGRAHGNCFNETSMIQNSTFWGAGARDSIIQVMGDVLSKTDVPITLLNITQLSMYRKDAHTSIYKKQWNPITPEQKANPTTYADCIHWCVPGLPDTWNEILFTKIFYP